MGRMKTGDILLDQILQQQLISQLIKYINMILLSINLMGPWEKTKISDLQEMVAYQKPECEKSVNWGFYEIKF